MSFVIKKNDRSPSLTCALEAPAGSPVDLTGASVVFRMVAVGANTLKVNAAANITDEEGGEISYDWAVGDTDTPGLYYAEWVVTFGNGVPQTYPAEDYLWIVVKDNLASGSP